MYIELKADDVMPFGKHIGKTLREVYKLDAGYFRQLCSQTNDYIISKRTQEIVTKNLKETEKSTPSYSKASQKKRPELKPDERVSGGPFDGKTLYEIFSKNESYYRYLCENRYFISKTSFEEVKRRTIPSCANKEVTLPRPNKASRVLQTRRFLVPSNIEAAFQNSKDKEAAEIFQRLRFFEEIDPVPFDFILCWSSSIEKIISSAVAFEIALTRITDLRARLDITKLDTYGFFDILASSRQKYQTISSNIDLLLKSPYFPAINDCPELKTYFLFQKPSDLITLSKHFKYLSKIEWDRAQNSISDVVKVLLSRNPTNKNRRAILDYIGKEVYTFKESNQLLEAPNSMLNDILSRIDILDNAIEAGEIKKPSARILCEILTHQTDLEFDRWLFQAKLSQTHPTKDDCFSSPETTNHSLKICTGNCSVCNRTPCPFD